MIETLQIKLFGKNSNNMRNYPNNIAFIKGLKRIRCKNFNCGLNLVPLDAKCFKELESLQHVKENNSNIEQNLFKVFIPNGYLANTTNKFQELKLDFGPMSVLNDYFMVKQLKWLLLPKIKISVHTFDFNSEHFQPVDFNQLDEMQRFQDYIN